MAKLIFRDILKKEYILYLVSSLFVLFTYILWSFVLFDEEAVYQAYGGKNMLNSHDSQFIDNIGVVGITRQSYLLPLFFLFVILLVFFVFFGYLSYRRHGKDIMLMRIRGMSKWDSQYQYLFLRTIMFFLTCLLTLLPYLLFLFIFFLIGQTEHMIIRFTPWLFLFMFIYSLLFLVINLPFYKRPYSKKKLVRFIRENY